MLFCTAQRCFIHETKLTVRVSRVLLQNDKIYAQNHNTTLTKLINTYLQQIPVKTVLLENAPIIRQLSGTLSIIKPGFVIHKLPCHVSSY